MALNRVAIPSPNYSARGAAVRLIVLHTAEGSRTIESLGSFFASSSSGVSSHAGADDKANTIGVYVKRADKAWTQGNANPVAVSIELCGFAAWDAAEWHRHPNMLDNCAKWIAEEAAAFGLPITRLTPAEAQGSGRGVCMHRDLGSWGGGHVDVGDGFPFAEVLQMAAGSSGSSPPQSSPITGEQMICTDPQSGGVWVVASKEGAIHALDGAPYIGATNNTQMNANKYPCVGLDVWKDPKGQTGLVMVLDWGNNPGDRFRRYRFPRDGTGKAKTGTTY